MENTSGYPQASGQRKILKISLHEWKTKQKQHLKVCGMEWKQGAEKKKGIKWIMYISMWRNQITKEQEKSKVDCLKKINKIDTLPAKLVKGGSGESTYIRN